MGKEGDMTSRSQPVTATAQGAATPTTEPSAGSGQDRLLLKWGTVKGWDLKTEAARTAMRAYADAGEQSLSAMAQRDTPEQKDALCALIDAIDGEIQNDWSGERMTKDEAKAYVRDYGAGR